jgi:raffinose/stachyose/melibiose transport system permease protein
VDFVGLKNYLRVLNGKSGFLGSVGFTVRLSICTVIATNVLGILLALLLTSGIVKRNSAYRAIFYIPNTIGGVILGFIWQFIFILGLPKIGTVLGSGFLSQQWLGTPEGAFLALLIVNVWKTTGTTMIVMIAAFTGVSQDLIEAATIDGAGFWKIFWKMKIPLCIPFITVNLFWSISNAFKMFELNYTLTEGGPAGATVSMALNIYNNAFANNKYGLACSEAVVFFIIVMIVTGVQLKISASAEEKRA